MIFLCSRRFCSVLFRFVDGWFQCERFGGRGIGILCERNGVAVLFDGLGETRSVEFVGKQGREVRRFLGRTIRRTECVL